MKKYWKATVNLAIALAVLAAIFWLLPKIAVFFAPFIVGWIVALIAGPLVRFFEERLKIKRKAGSAFVIIVVIGLVVLVLYLLGARLVDEVVGLANALPEIWKSMETDFANIGKNLSVIYSRFPKNIQNGFADATEQITGYIGSALSKLGTPTIAAVGNFAKQLPSVMIGIIMALLSAYFFVADRASINAWFKRTMPDTVQKRYMIMRRSMKKAVGGYFKAQFKIEIWVYLLLVIGFSVLGVNYALLIALGIAILDFLPFFGTGTVMVPWAIIKFLSADYLLAIGLLIIWGVGQLVRQIIQPKIVGDSIGMPSIPTLFLLFVGYKFGSVLGMIFAVPIGLIIFTMYDEGVFDTTKNSIRILVNGINHFRRLEAEDLEGIDKKDE